MLEEFWHELNVEGPHSAHMLVVTFRLLLAAVIGALPGMQRERIGTPAGLRTHMLVSLGSAVFAMAALEAGATTGDTTRVIQGVATGIGFVGAGAILRLGQGREVHGLTTAASVWLTAALGTAAGLGRIWLPVVAALIATFILSVLRRFEKHRPLPEIIVPSGHDDVSIEQ